MMLRETDMEIKVLARQGTPKTEIARRLGVSRQTVYNHLNREAPYPKPRRRRGSKLDAFKEYIETRLGEFDLPATTLYREIEKQGYQHPGRELPAPAPPGRRTRRAYTQLAGKGDRAYAAPGGFRSQILLI